MPKRIGFQKSGQLKPTFIKQWREYRQLTQEQLAARLETSGSMISRIENGESNPGLAALEAIAEALNTSVPSLLMRDPTPNDDGTDAMWSLWDQAKPADRVKIVETAKIILGKTGT